MEENKNEEIKPPTLAALFKVVFVEWCLSSTAHAIPNIFRTGNVFLKIFWTLCLMTSGVYCFYSMIVSLQQFLSYPTYFSTEIVQEIPAPFPAVTVCNIKTVNKTASLNLFQQASLQPYMIDPSMMRSSYEYIVFQQYQINRYLSTLSDSEKRNIGFQLNDMLISCYFNNEGCSANDFTYYYHNRYGNCYTFNSGKYNNGTKADIKTISMSEDTYGFVMELFLGNPQVDTIFDALDGLVISIHNQTVLPFSDGVKIMTQTGTNTDIIVSRSFLSKLGGPYSDCLSDISAESKFRSYSFDYIVRSMGLRYTQKHCNNLCIQKKTMDKCGCANLYFPLFETVNMTVCSYVDVTCIYEILTTVNQINKECLIQCPFECSTISYDISTFKSSYPTQFYQDILSNYSLLKYSHISYDDIPSAVAKVNVFYNDLTYKQTTEVAAITTEAFFSNMGGTLGLYIGISLLSFVEMIELAINLVIVGMGYSKAKSQVNSAVRNEKK